MTEWSVAEAKARWSEVLDQAAREPQLVRRRGKRTAVVVSAATWDHLAGERQAHADQGNAAIGRFLARCDELRKEAAGLDLGLVVPDRAPAAPESPFGED